MKRVLRFSLIASSTYAIIANASAVAASPAVAYSGIHGNVQGGVLGATASSGSTSLPFTGFDVTLMGAGVLLLVVLGAGLRRFAGPNA